MGITGAALATGIGQSVPAIAGLFFFLLSRKGLYFTRFRLHGKELLMACYNGSSEMVTQLSNAVITLSLIHISPSAPLRMGVSTWISEISAFT